MNDVSLVRVVFLFPDSSEIRYLKRPPRPGRSVRSEQGRSWVVSEVLPSGAETYTAVCAAGAHQIDVGALAGDLLSRARQAAAEPLELRARWRRRHYLP